MKLESRYRRLLALYPAGHRDLYEEEMVAVLLADAAPGQTRPRSAESLNLVASALRERVRYAGAAITGSRWRDAAALLGTLLPVLLVLKVSRPVLMDTIYALRTHGSARVITPWEWCFLAGWTAVTAFALAGWRRIAALVAAGVAVAQAVQLDLLYATDPVTVLYATWSFLVALLVVVCLAYGRGAGQLRVLLSPRARRAYAVAAMLTFIWPAVDLLLGRVWEEDGWAYIETPGGIGIPFLHTGYAMQSTVSLCVVGGAALAGMTGVAYTAGRLRRRLLALVAPVAAMLIMVNTAFDGFAMSSVRFDPPVLLVPAQWIALVGVPAAAFGIAALLVHRRERTLELVELGLAARRGGNPGAGPIEDAEQSAP